MFAFRACLLAFLVTSGCGDDDVTDAAVDTATEAATDTGSDAVALAADADAPPFADVDETIVLDGSASTGATSWEWDLGDGRK